MKTVAIIVVIAALFISGCTGTENAATVGNCGGITCGAVSPAGDAEGGQTAYAVDKVEVFHFHGTHQCSSCIAVGELAEKTVNTYFKDELESGKIVFGHVNGELAENAGLVQKYGVTGSSLWIGTYYADGTFSKEENVNVWYKISDDVGYMEYLKGILQKRLRGELV